MSKEKHTPKQHLWQLILTSHLALICDLISASSSLLSCSIVNLSDVQNFMFVSHFE